MKRFITSFFPPKHTHTFTSTPLTVSHFLLSYHLTPMDQAFKIDFVGIGASKAGTTWLGHMIGAHPQCCMSEPKEVHYFNDRLAFRSNLLKPNFTKGISWYRKYFKHCGKDTIKGEITPRYFTDPVVPERIKAHNPDVKIFVCIRNPVDRIYSHYFFAKSFLQKEDRPMLQAVQEEPEYLDMSKYYENISMYLDHFPREQFFFVWFDDIRHRPETLLSEVYSFLGVDPSYRPRGMVEKSNPARQSRIPWLQNAIRRLHYFMVSIGLSGMIKSLKRAGMKDLVMAINSKPIKKEPMPKEVREYIIQQVRDDVHQLEKLLDKDLSHWLITD